MSALFDTLEQKFQTLQFGQKPQQAFLEDFSALIKDGVPANQAIETIYEISKGSTQQVARDIADAIAQGQPIAEGMEKWFANATVEIIRAGETSGTLETAVEAAANSLGHQAGATKEIVNAMLYPAVVVMAALGMVVFVRVSVFDKFVDIKPVADWPPIGQTLYYLGGAVQHGWWLIALMLGGGILGITKTLQYLTGDLRKTIDRLPILSLYRESVAARFMETLGRLLTNGVALNKALTIMQQDAAPYLGWHLIDMELRLSGGKENIADVLDTGLINESDILRLRVVARGKGFEKALLSLGMRAQERVYKLVAITGKIFGGVFLGLGGLIAASVVFGIYTVGSAVAT